MPLEETRPLVYGPAYVDIVLRVAGPIASTPIDLGCDGRFEPAGGDSLAIVCPNGARLVLQGLDNARNPTGTLRTTYDVLPAGLSRDLAVVDAVEDLGGMGAGYAACLGGRLVSALAGGEDPLSARVRKEIARHGIDHAPVVLADRDQADTTIIVTSGPNGDKLPIGLRGCHAQLTVDQASQTDAHGIVIAASLDNALMHALFESHPSALRVLAPSARNCRDRNFPLGRLANMTDLLALNAAEWATLAPDDRQAFEASRATISMTRGPEGAEISWIDTRGRRDRHFEPAFPRSRPPVDTNRAGEAFAANLIRSFSEQGWSTDRQPLPTDVVRQAARHASAAAGLVIDMPRFGFPTLVEVTQAVRAGSIP